MERSCQKCKEPVPQEAFLCPHCCAILETVQHNPVETKSKKAIKVNYRHIFSVILGLLLVAAAVLLLGSILKWVAPDRQDPTTQATEPTTEPAPLVAYEVKVRTDNRKNLQGILVQVCKDGEVLYSCEAGSYGSATFILPQSDGYTIRLSQMPEPFQMFYGTTEFPFEPGQQYLQIMLQTEKVPYIVKVVNREGEPLPDTRIYFYGSSNQTSAITDAYGMCVFEDKYLATGYQVNILSYTTGYYAEQWIFDFEEGSLELTIVLDRYEDVELPVGYSLYKVRVVDELGQPIGGLYTAFFQDNWSSFFGYTNSDGVAVFKARDREGEKSSISFPQNVDYSHLSFPFAEGAYEQEITLQTQNTTGPWIYQVIVRNQYTHPVSDVVVAYQNPDGTISYYTSDYEGMVQIELPEEDPTKVTVWIHQVPEGYEESKFFYEGYTFYPFSRVMDIEILFVQQRQVSIVVVDENGNPVPNAVVAVRDGNHPGDITYLTTGPNGVIYVVLDPMTYYEAWVYEIPEGYSPGMPLMQIYATDGEVVFVLESLVEEIEGEG